ncbi:hypothetical protein EMIHUDRAFT_228555 [Emiliania huxleyi CCMP1516]|uniref:Uncharacterized protein n=2 Tax=Emiliania huxleyi TaxID=2903 RepID=A0A0D3KFN5_EMIH1|nr:hypothetical protein EMIHUDRAFT_228555 [Emiliania huxleyi CCMP1516]EOD34570.1 hypothetical protein EMIHUDRAFT_228555 [Emiliania huxleyi CCMP1516]|eukprot:XP_005786999.1 hypothetical protein EMIHUDRAFT_228555 [Emiliania huxleyi CCMP1516]
MAASPAIDLGETLAALFKRARVADNLYRRYEGRLAELGVGDAGDLLEEVAEKQKGIGSLDIHDRQAEKLRRALLGRRGWGDAAAAAEGGSGGGTEGSSLDPLEPALPESGDGTIAAAGGEEEGPDTAAGLAAERPNPVEEATGSEAGEAAAEALAEAAVDAVYGALVAATLEEWAGASTDNPISAADARGPGLECQQCFGSFYDEFGVEPWLWRRALREGWSELGGWSREEMEAAEKEIWRGESSEISQLGEWVCDACLEGFLGGGFGDYSMLRKGHAPSANHPWIGEGWEGGARPEEYDGLFDGP